MTSVARSSVTLRAEVASTGVARGTAFVLGERALENVPRRTIAKGEAGKEMERFDTTVVEAEKELLALQQRVRETVGEEEAEIFEVQILLLHDPSLREKVSVLCITKRLNLEAALDEAIKTLTSAFVRLEDPYFRERAADLQDIGMRLLDLLMDSSHHGTIAFPEGCVLVAKELFPSLIGQLDAGRIQAVVVEKGGQTAHATILARAHGIPLLINVDHVTEAVHTGDELIVDGLVGRVYSNPSPTIQEEYDRLDADMRAHQTALEGLTDLPTLTADGVPIGLCANIGKSADASAAASLNADGVGLYRTEDQVFRIGCAIVADRSAIMCFAAAIALK